MHSTGHTRLYVFFGTRSKNSSHPVVHWEKKSLLDPKKNGNLLWYVLVCKTAVIVQKTTCFFFARDIRQSFVHPNANSEALFWTSSAAAMYCLFCWLVVIIC